MIANGPCAFDAVLLNVDNGPTAFTTARNRRLCCASGLAAVRRALRPGGTLGVWSADAEPSFVRRLERAGFAVEVATVPARPCARGPRHTIFVAC